MLPLQDINPTRRVPYITYGLIAINVIVFLTQLGLSERQLAEVYVTQSVVPVLVARDPFSIETILDFIRSMFFHGGWAHLLGNMLYLWIFGDNVEDVMGKPLYILFYLVCGFVAAFAQVVIDPTSQIPLVGASGAIAGVLGSYLILFPGVRVRGLILLGYFSRLTEIPALYVLGFWFVLQLFNGVMSLGVVTDGGGVAFFAHIGGFVAGIVLTWLFTRIKPQPPVEERRNQVYQQRGRPYR
ncbi:MAG: rhomboid family intramembrane serine protease [Anaerolineae bacterium]|nr:rhomboid family intramembrane serine protease [Anaerolineae bacterium]